MSLPSFMTPTYECVEEGGDSLHHLLLSADPHRVVHGDLLDQVLHALVQVLSLPDRSISTDPHSGEVVVLDPSVQQHVPLQNFDEPSMRLVPLRQQQFWVGSHEFTSHGVPVDLTDAWHFGGVLGQPCLGLHKDAHVCGGHRPGSSDSDEFHHVLGWVRRPLLVHDGLCDRCGCVSVLAGGRKQVQQHQPSVRHPDLDILRDACVVPESPEAHLRDGSAGVDRYS